MTFFLFNQNSWSFILTLSSFVLLAYKSDKLIDCNCFSFCRLSATDFLSVLSWKLWNVSMPALKSFYLSKLWAQKCKLSSSLHFEPSNLEPLRECPGQLGTEILVIVKVFKQLIQRGPKAIEQILVIQISFTRLGVS